MKKRLKTFHERRLEKILEEALSLSMRKEHEKLYLLLEAFDYRKFIIENKGKKNMSNITHPVECDCDLCIDRAIKYDRYTTL